MRNTSFTAAIVACVFAVTVHAAQKGAESGLVGTYADGKHRIVTIAVTPNFVLKDSESIHPQLGSGFSAEWNGVLKIDRRAKYTSGAQGNVETKIAIDGRAVTGELIDLDLGDHPIKIEFTRKPGAARLQLMWSADFFAQEPVPPSVLFHPAASPEASRQSKVEAGQWLVEELNCVACHRSLSTVLSARSAPELSTVGTRLHSGWIEHWLQDPRAFRSSLATRHRTCCRSRSDWSPAW